jgi:hypothetical protein
LFHWLEAHVDWLGWLWSVGVLLLSLRLLGGYFIAQRWRRQGTAPLPEAYARVFEQWTRRMAPGRRVQGLLSTRVPEPLTLGFWTPVVLFPAALITQLTPAQVEALLVHELAHVRRADYLVNLLQLVLDLCFFYHPLFYLLSRTARRRREDCCDDLVIRYTAQRLPYAQALTELNLSLLNAKNPFAMNARGNSHFTQRVLRIAGIEPQKSNRANWLLLFFFFAVLALSITLPTPSQAVRAAGFDLPVPARSALAPPSTEALADTAPPRRVRPEARKAPAPTPAADKPSDQSVYGVAVAPAKMNVLYIGIDNPVTIAAAGVPAGEIFVRINGDGTITGSGVDYNVVVRQPGEVGIEVFRRAADGQLTPLSTQRFRVKRIPDPVPLLNGSFRSGAMRLEDVAKLQDIRPVVQNFEFEAGCSVVSFTMTILPSKANPYEFSVVGGAIPEKHREALKALPVGSSVFFDDIKVLCPGDAGARNVGGVAVKVRE